MVTTIGIGPHKAMHTAVAIDETETVLGELTVPADRYQTARLMGWTGKLNGNARIRAVEAAGGLAICCPGYGTVPACGDAPHRYP